MGGELEDLVQRARSMAYTLASERYAKVISVSVMRRVILTLKSGRSA